MRKLFDPEEHVRYMAKAMEIPIQSDWLPAVIANMVATAAAAELVLSLPLADDVEPAPVFEA